MQRLKHMNQPPCEIQRDCSRLFPRIAPTNQGARVHLRDVLLGDSSMSALEVWGAEYQENDVALVADSPEGIGMLTKICERERLPFSVVARVSGDGRVVVTDTKSTDPDADTAEPVFDLPLDLVLGELPQKNYAFDSWTPSTPPLGIPAAKGEDPCTALLEHLKAVLRLPSVGSKRFLTTKVDRSVTGLVAGQQCQGPLLLPVGDNAIIARSHLGFTGGATSIGEQPLKGLINPGAMARMSLGEALTNIASVRITELSDIKASVNWMYAAKMDSDGAHMYEACEAISDAMIALGVAVDGGKDSLSMAAAAPGEAEDGKGEGKVKAPPQVVVSAYALVPDITCRLTTDIKSPGESQLVHVDVSGGRRRLGGSAFAQTLSQVGALSPDLDDPNALASAFRVLQRLLADERRGGLLACHDISDGGLAACVLEMCFAGDCGVDLMLDESAVVENERHLAMASHDADASPAPHPLGTAYASLFAEELGWVVEVANDKVDDVLAAFAASGVAAHPIGSTTPERTFSAKVASSANGTKVSDVVSSMPTYDLLSEWEETSFRLEATQCLEACVDEERASLAARCGPSAPVRSGSAWSIDASRIGFTDPSVLEATDKVRVCVLREEGSNGDREMCAAVYAAGMEPWDVTTTDLIEGRASLDDFRGIVFVGGFSYADVLDSAKGWAGAIRFNDEVRAQFDRFRARDDTFSLGVCNGCQLMALLGWIPTPGGVADDVAQPRFVHNRSERFESRFATVVVDSESTNSIMLKDLHGTVCGVWVAHGEGRFYAPGGADEAFYRECVPMQYADPTTGAATEAYPYNPNGSPNGTAAVCSEDGRHLAMMPHPERCIFSWQMPYVPPDAGLSPVGPTPWLTMFQAARRWCE